MKVDDIKELVKQMARLIPEDVDDDEKMLIHALLTLEVLGDKDMPQEIRQMYEELVETSSAMIV